MSVRRRLVISRRHPHAVLVLLKIRYRAAIFFCAFEANGLRSMVALSASAFLQMRHGRARRRPKQSERGFRFDGEFDVGQPQALLHLIEHRLPQICTSASPPSRKKLFFSLAFTRSEISSRSPMPQRSRASR